MASHKTPHVHTDRFSGLLLAALSLTLLEVIALTIVALMR